MEKNKINKCITTSIIVIVLITLIYLVTTFIKEKNTNKQPPNNGNEINMEEEYEKERLMNPNYPHYKIRYKESDDVYNGQDAIMFSTGLEYDKNYYVIAIDSQIINAEDYEVIDEHTITINKEFLNTLEEGEHIIEIDASGGIAHSVFYVYYPKTIEN